MDAREITRTTALFDRSGIVQPAGWARHPYFAYNRQTLRRRFSSLKEWEHYVVIDLSRRFIVDLEMMDGSWRSVCSVAFIDMDRRQSACIQSPRLFSGHCLDLSTSSALDSQATYQDKDGRLTLTFMKRGGMRHIIFNAPSLELPDGRKGLLGDFSMAQDEEGESINFLFSEGTGSKAFILGEKVPGMRVVDGFIRRGMDKDMMKDGIALAILDWGRGTPSGHIPSIGATAVALVDGHVRGFNLGYSGDGIQNAFLLDGRITKLPPMSSCGDKEMTMHSQDDAHLVRFTPLAQGIEQKAKGKRRTYGTFSGRFTLEDGTVLPISDMPGWVEMVGP